MKFQGEGGEILEVEDTGAVLTAALDVPAVGGGDANYIAAGTTGTIGAALAAGSALFAGIVPSTASNPVQVKRLRMQWTTIVAFAVPVTRRSLALFHGYGASAISGGTRIEPPKKNSTGYNSALGSIVGGHLWVATTTGLTITGAQFDANPWWEAPFTDVGGVGGFAGRERNFDEAFGGPFILRPGELFAIRNPFIMDATGTWQLTVEIEWNEAARHD